MNLKQRNSVLRFTLSPEERGQKERISCFHFTQLNRTNTRIAQLKTGPEHHILEKDRDAGSTWFLSDNFVLLFLMSGTDAAKKPQNCGWLGCIWKQVCFLWKPLSESGISSAFRASCGFVALVHQKSWFGDNSDMQTSKRAKWVQLIHPLGFLKWQRLKICACVLNTYKVSDSDSSDTC